MKRMLLALAILALGTSVFCAFQNVTTQLQREAADTRAAWLAQTQLIAQATIERTKLEERVRELKRSLAADQMNVAHASIPIPDRDAAARTPEQCEKLLGELGFNWNTTGDYLVVSKSTLRGTSLNGMNGVKLTDAAGKVLAITPEERATIEAMTQQLGTDYAAWAQAHVRREEPSGDVLAKYTLPVDAEFSESLSNRFSGGIVAALAAERGALLRNYSAQWMVDLTMKIHDAARSATTMTVKRHTVGDERRLGLELRQGGGTMHAEVSPWQPFPAAFRPIFPGGWQEVAQREGFELPEEFQKK